MNLEGLNDFRKNPKEFILTIRDLCWTNNIPVCYLENEDTISISLLDEKTSRGLLLESNGDKIPFMVDYDDDVVFPERDCPTLEECFARFWTLNKTLPFSREKVLNLDAFYLEAEAGNIAQTDYENYYYKLWSKENEWRFEDMSRAEIKSAIVNSAEDICEVATRDKEDLRTLIKDYTNASFLEGDDNQLNNLEMVRDMYEQISTMHFE